MVRRGLRFVKQQIKRAVLKRGANTKNKKVTAYKQRKRLSAIAVLVIFLFTAVLAKLIYVIAFEGEELQSKALEQWYRDVPIQGERGDILDRNGVVLASCETVYTLYLRPIACKDKDATARILSEVLSLKYDYVYSKLNSKASEVTLKQNVDKATMLAVVKSGASGVYVSETVKRVYPYGDFMSQVLGFTNVDTDGQTGVEAYYNDYLKGRNGYAYTSADLVGRELEEGITYYVEGTKGGTAHLTLDARIQHIVENAVSECMVNQGAKEVSCVVMDPNTGAIIAMAQSPSFDLNNVPRDNVAELFKMSKSWLVGNVFEPGSTFKIVTSAIGLDSGKISTSYRCYCGGSMTVDGQKIKCWKYKGHGSQSFQEGVQNSCNCLFMNIALTVGTSEFYSGLKKLGITEKTGIDISGEASALTIPEASVKNVDLARIGFGQAIAVTPIELLRSCSAVINGGNLVTPYVMESITDENGEILYQNQGKITKNVVSAQTSATMREILESVVLVGSGKNAQVTGLRIGGKTGTAQKYENGAIARGKYVSTFVGFAPADNPEYIALIVVDEPDGAYYGSIVAAPYVGEIFKNIYAI